MKALVLTDFNSTPTLKDIDKPVPGAGEVLIQVRSAGLNPLDLKIMAGQAAHAQVKPPAVPGIDVSGIVVSTGKDVTAFKPGDEVYGMAGGVGDHQGSLAEFITADTDLLALKPANLSFHDTASLPLVFITAWEALVDRAKVHTGQKVLIHGGGGGVGHIASQIAVSRGAEVFATVNKSQIEQMKHYGVVPIDYSGSSPASYVDQYTNGEGFDVIMDNVGGKTLDDSFEAIKRYTGHVVSILGWGAHSLAPLSFRGASYSGVFTLYPLLSGKQRSHHGEILAQATKLIEAGLVKPLVSPDSYSLENAMNAYQAMRDGSGKGKLVVDVS